MVEEHLFKHYEWFIFGRFSEVEKVVKDDSCE